MILPWGTWVLFPRLWARGDLLSRRGEDATEWEACPLLDPDGPRSIDRLSGRRRREVVHLPRSPCRESGGFETYLSDPFEQTIGKLVVPLDRVVIKVIKDGFSKYLSLELKVGRGPILQNI